MNYNYEKGKRKEQKIAQEARQNGCLAIRSAGSKGNVDVAIFDHKSRQIRLIQCKPDDISENAKQKLIDEMADYNGYVFNVTFEVI